MTIDKSLIKSFVKTTERGAYGASMFRGKNDKIEGKVRGKMIKYMVKSDFRW